MLSVIIILSTISITASLHLNQSSNKLWPIQEAQLSELVLPLGQLSNFFNKLSLTLLASICMSPKSKMKFMRIFQDYSLRYTFLLISETCCATLAF
jgi:hypothetical protein